MALNDLGNVPAGTTIPLFFTSHDAATGANETMSGLAVGDILCYKGTSMTQRSSTSGLVLIDTDGIDLDSLTGVNGVSIDLSDNADAGFWAAGSYYNIVLGPVTIDAQTMNIHLATFRIVAAEGTAGTPVADATRWNNLATVALPLVPTTAGRTLDVSTTGEAGVDWANVGSPTTAVDLSGTNIKTNQKVDVDTIKTNPVVNGGTITFPTTATLASTTNLTAGTVATVTNRVTANADQWAGGTIPATTVTGVPLVDVKYLLGTIFTEGAAGRLAAGIIKFFNIAAPASTMDALTLVATATTATTATNLTNAPTNGDFTATMKTSIGTAVAASAVASVTGTVGGNVTGSVGSLAAQAKADVNAEVVDAVNVDTYAEPGQGTPGATVSLAAKIGYLYKAWRNKSTTTATEYALYNDDAVTKDQKAALSDDATTATKGEVATGA